MKVNSLNQQTALRCSRAEIAWSGRKAQDLWATQLEFGLTLH